MKISYILFFIYIFSLAFISCKSKEKEYNQGNDEFTDTEIIMIEIDDENSKTNKNIDKNTPVLINSPNDESIDIEFDITGINLARLTDADMIHTAIYQTESDAIENINEIEPNQIVTEILDKPFGNIDLSIFSENSGKRVFNGIEELLNIFDIRLSQNNIEKFHSIIPYREFKIAIENLTMVIYKESFNDFKLFFVEYDSDYFYIPKLKAELTKNDILNLLGSPSAYSDERNIFIYSSNKTLRQINIYFESDIEKIKYIQLISWGGI